MTNPGWFDDPNSETNIRYFDGRKWTERTRPKPGTQALAEGNKPAVAETGTQNGNPDWLPIAIVGAVVGTLGIIGLVIVVTGDDDSVVTSNSSQPASPTATTTSAQSDLPLPTQPRATEAETTTTTFVEGPIPKNEWILIWESRDKTVYSRADVEDEANGFRNNGIAVEVLDSDEYYASDSAGQLNGGYWVIWSGPLSTRENVVALCQQWQNTYPRCYPRFVYPK